MRVRKNTNHSLIPGLLALLWAGIIFYLSSLPGAGTAWPHDIWFYVERKGAHVGEFFILAALLAWFFRNLTFTEKPGMLLLAAGTAAFAYAAIDELHQLTVFGREGKISDVIIDLAGVALALGLFSVWTALRGQQTKSGLHLRRP